MKFWPPLQEQAQKLADALLRRGWPVDPDQIESDALDYVVDAVRSLTDERLLMESLKEGLRLLRSKVSKRTTRRKEVQPPTDTFLNKLVDDRPDTSVESLMEELEVPEHCRSLLLRVAYRQEGETIPSVLGRSELRRWRRYVQPELQKWARNELRRAE